jgi:hypothetical protein
VAGGVSAVSSDDEKTNPAIQLPPPEKPVHLVIYDATTMELLDYAERTNLNCMCPCKCGGARLLGVTPARVTVRHGERYIVITAVDAPGTPPVPRRRREDVCP